MGTIVQRGADSWRLYYDLPAVAGKRRQRTKTVHGTKRDAKRELARLESQVAENNYSEPGRITVQGLMTRWLESTERALSTQRRYRGLIEKNIVPIIGKQLLVNLSPLAVEDAIKAWRKMPRQDRKGTRALSGRTIHHIWSAFKAACEYGVRNRILSSNPCSYVTPPQKPKSRVKAISVDDALIVWDGLLTTDLGCPMMLAFCSGLRRGELLALHVSDVDLVNRKVIVRHALTTTDHGDVILKTTKSGRVREVNLPEVAVPLLQAHLENRAWKSSPFLFPDPLTGRVWKPDVFSSAFYFAIRSRDLPTVSVHGLRHSFATAMLRAKVPIKIVSEMLGQSTTAITADTYSHVLDEMRAEAAANLNSVLQAGLFNRGKSV